MTWAFIETNIETNVHSQYRTSLCIQMRDYNCYNPFCEGKYCGPIQLGYGAVPAVFQVSGLPAVSAGPLVTARDPGCTPSLYRSLSVSLFYDS